MKHFNGWGGKRSGAGRRYGSKNLSTVATNEAKQLMIQVILRYWLPIVQTLINEGLGRYKYEKTIDGKTRIYQARPSPQVLYNLITFVVGKPVQPTENKVDAVFESPAMHQIADEVKSIFESLPIKAS